MRNAFYELPSDLSENIDTYEREVLQFLADDMPAGVLKAKRVPRGVYEQRNDGVYMLRVRVAGGALEASQAEELAALAEEYADGQLHVTTRQDLQLHDVAIEDTPAIMRRLMAVGLTSLGGGGNTVRNISACPYAGICGHENFDVTPFAQSVTEYLISLRGSYNLPRKYKIAFSGCASDCALAQVADLGFVAQIKNALPGFQIYAGGGMGANSRVADKLIEWIPASEVIRASEAVRRLFDQLGDRGNRNRARLRYVFEKIGPAEFRNRFWKKMELVSREGVPRYEKTTPINNSHTAASQGAPELSSSGGVHCLPQRQEGFVAVHLHLPLGFVSADDFAKLAKLTHDYSEENGLRTTRSQNLIVRFVRRERLDSFVQELLKLGSDMLATNPMRCFVACAGAATCRLGLCMARGAASACSDQLASAGLDSKTLDDLDIRINGCPNSCGQQPVAPIGFYGVAQRCEGRLMPCYRATFGGRCNQDGARLGAVAGQIPAKAMPALLVDIARDFEAGRMNGESFDRYFDRQGNSHFEKLVNSHAKTPAYSQDPEFYRDFGVDEDFSLAGRGAGECGAGVFEVIQADLNAARKAQTPWDRLHATTRALLITRGIDTRSPDEILFEFEKHFVDSGLISDEFRDIIAQGQRHIQGCRQALESCEFDVDRLLERVELLFSTLDSNLEFNPPKNESIQACAADVQTADTASRKLEATQNAELDLRGVGCPLNFVKAKLRLESMQIHDCLAILLDDGEPVKNVPASFQSEGQTIEEITEIRDGNWRVVVKKKR